MRSVLPPKQFEPFDAQTADTMAAAFSSAWSDLTQAGQAPATGPAAERMREVLALRIIDRAGQGERDLDRLRDDAIAFVLRPDARNKA